MKRVGIYLGDYNDPTENIQSVLTIWGSYLKDSYELETFGSATLPSSANPYYYHFSTKSRSSRVGFDKILSSYLATREYIRNRRPDAIIQIWKYKTHAPGVSVAGKRFETPVISRLSGDAFNEYRQEPNLKRYALFLLTALFGRFPIRFSDKIITLGPYERDLLERRGANKEDVIILPPPLDRSERFSPPKDKYRVRGDLNLPSDRKIALYVGRVTKQKGMDFLIKVINQVTPRTDYQFLLVGDGPYLEHFENSYDISTVRVEGRVSYERIHKYYQASDVFVHPSPYEGIPLVFLEALECGVPIIARDVGDNAFITDNVVNSVDEMVELLLNPPSEAKFRNRELFLEPYQRSTLIDTIDTVIQETT